MSGKDKGNDPKGNSDEHKAARELADELDALEAKLAAEDEQKKGKGGGAK